MRIELDIPEQILDHLLSRVTIPDVAYLRYDMPTPPSIADIAAVLGDKLRAPSIRESIQPGQTIAIGIGSRGIANLDQIATRLVSELRSWGTQPFIFPAMGSHGGATADGQQEVLARLGVTEERVGAPIRSSMDVVEIGRTESGASVFLDRIASEADAIVFVARIKPHTAFRGPYESGLAKMVAIGLGKQAGAAATHARGFASMAQMVPEMARLALSCAPICFGVAVLENAYDRPFRIEVVPAARILLDEPALLNAAKAAMPRLPFDDIDILVIDRIGKNISGDGADPNITGRYPTPDASGGPRVGKQVVLDLDDRSHGNANGIGTADFTTARLARKMDLGQTYPNALTSTIARPVALPMILPSDRDAIAASILTCNAVGREPRLVRIVDTLHLDRLWISAALFREAESDQRLSTLDPPAPLDFDADGNLRGFANRLAPTAIQLQS